MSASKITEYLLKYRPSHDWIVNKSGLPYLRLGISVPIEDVCAEWATVNSKAVAHRDSDTYGPASNTGWKSLVLYGVDSQQPAAVSDNMGWTDIAEDCPATVKWINDTFVINETTGRIRFMLLEPGGFIVPHKDRDYNKLSEVNIAITNPRDCVFRFKDYGTVPFEPGSAFMMDIGYEHFVVNNSVNPRLHIIAHARLKDETLISTSYANRYYS